MFKPLIQVMILNAITIALQWSSLVQTTKTTRWMFITLLSLSAFLWVYISYVVDIPTLGSLLERIRII